MRRREISTRVLSLTLSLTLSRKDIRENCVARSGDLPDDRRETSPLRNDRDNLPLSFVSSFAREENTDRRLFLPFLPSFLPSLSSEYSRSRFEKINSFHRHGMNETRRKNRSNGGGGGGGEGGNVNGNTSGSGRSVNY